MKKSALLIVTLILAIVFSYGLLKPITKKQDVDLSTKLKDTYVKSFRDGFMIGWFSREYNKLENVKIQANKECEKYRDWVNKINK